MKHLDSSSSSEQTRIEGNSISSIPKQISPSKRWVFTYNNYTLQDCSSIVLTLQENCNVAICGKEVGESGTPHLQGYCEFRKKVRPIGLFHTDKIWWQKAKGKREENLGYCIKQGQVILKMGFPKGIQIIEQLWDWQQNIVDIYNSEPDDRTINWFWDEKGGIGKSAFMKYMAVKHDICFCSGGKYSDIMNLIFNTDMDSVSGVFFDIPRANRGKISYASLESIKNGMVCNTKYETGFKVFNSPHIFIFANFPPDDIEQLSADRWNIVELVKDVNSL